MRRLRPLLVLALLAAFAVAGYFGYQRYTASEATVAPKYLTAEVAIQDVTVSVTATGTISPVVTVDVGSQVSGRIAALHADYNSQVTKGQVLAELDPVFLVSQVSQAKANLEVARAGVKVARVALDEARRQEKRNRALASKALVSVEEADAAQSSVARANAELASARARQVQAEASLDQAKINLNYATIVSPIDGVVIARSMEVGQTVAASFQAPTLFTLAEDLRQMEVHTSVAESDVARIKAGTPVEFTVDAYSERTFSGQVKEVRFEAQTVQNVVTYDAVVRVENPDLALRPGMTADVSFKVDEAKGALVVPNAALRFRTRDAMAKKSTQEGPPPGMLLGGPGGPPPGAMGGPPGASTAQTERTRKPRPAGERRIWVMDEHGELKPMPVQVGLTDGTVTAISGPDLKAGLKVVTGEDKASAKKTNNDPRKIL